MPRWQNPLNEWEAHTGRRRAAVVEYITFGFTLLRSLSFCFCSSNWRLFLSSSKSFCCCSNRFLKEKQSIKELASEIINCVIVILLTVSARSPYTSRMKTLTANYLIFLRQRHFPINFEIYKMSPKNDLPKLQIWIYFLSNLQKKGTIFCIQK